MLWMRRKLLERRRIRRRRVFFGILWVLAFFFAAGSVSLFFILRGLPDPARLTEQNIAQSTRIYDRTGTVVLYDVHGDEKRSVVPFAKLPAVLKNATVTVEDAEFYSHRGIDARGIMRALYVDLTSRGIRQGGSTITQQLITNSLLSRGTSVREKILRKIREIALAVIIETKFSKDEILSLYLNQIPYGSQAYGAEAAAETFFGKSVDQIDLAEAAFLASLPRAPSYYSPYGPHRDELMGRKDFILDRMAKLGYISADDATKAKKENLNIRKQRQNILAPHFIFYVRDYLTQTYGESLVEQGGLKVITSLDWDLQQKAEKIVREGAERNSQLIKAKNAALVAANPKTGEVLAMVGSRDYFADPEPKNCKPGVNCQFDPQVNVALRARQPGSAFKPFVYATAFAKGYTPDTVLFDVPTEFNPSCNSNGTAPAGTDPASCYSPSNYDDAFRGPVTIRQALAQSLNVPSVELLYLAGVMDSIETAKRLGITTVEPDPSRYGLALVLGGAEVRLLDMVYAYGAFANDGTQSELTNILRVEDAAGDVLEEHKPNPRQTLDPELARQINDVLSDNDARQPIFSPRSSLYFDNRQVAAKTGTTQDYRDAWTIGYTPSLVAGVWVGNNDNTSIQQKGSGVLAAAPIWHNFMEVAMGGVPPERFIKPVPIEVEKPILRGLWQGGQAVMIDKISKKLATSETPENLREEIVAGSPHTILYWVDKDDPRGSAPANPGADPQFAHWEEALRAWLANHPVGPQLVVPTEYDTLHTEANRPRLFVSDPKAGDIAPRKTALKLKFDLQSVFRIKEVDILLNDQITKTFLGPRAITEISIDISDLDAGDNTLKVRAVDDVENMREVSIPFLITP